MKITVVFPMLVGILLSILTLVYAQSNMSESQFGQQSPSHQAPGAAQSGQGAPLTPKEQAIQATPFLGDKRSKLYHRANCPGYRNVPAENRVPFQSDKQAEEAQYKRAPDCL